MTSRASMDLGPEFRLFCLALRWPQTSEDIREMEVLLATVRHWDFIVQGASRHRVASAVLAGLQRCNPPHIPAEVIAKLRQLSRAATRRSLAQVAEVGRLSDVFAEAGIRVLVLKGVAASAQLYGDPVWRVARDIDLLVHPDQVLLAHKLILEAGYRHRRNLQSPHQYAAYFRLMKELEYFHGVTGEIVELHHRLTANPNLLSVEFDSLWNERDEVSLGNRRVSTLPRRRLPLYLCAHGTDHGWARLHWLADFAAAVRQAENIDAIVEAASATGLTPVFLHALVLSHEWLGLPIEKSSLEAYANNAQAKRLAWLLGRLYAAADWHYATPKRGLRYALWERLYRFSLKPDWRYRADQLKADWFCPADWETVPLPPALRGLYPLVRPWGWLIRYVSHSRTRDRSLDSRRTT